MIKKTRNIVDKFKKITASSLSGYFFNVVYKHLAGLGKPAIFVACLAGPSGNSRCK